MAAPGPDSASREGEGLKEQIMQFWNSRVAREGKGGKGGGAEEEGASAKEALVWALGKLPVSLFPRVSKVYEVSSDASLSSALSLLEAHNLRCLPVRNAKDPHSADWSQRYLGVIDHSGIMLWVFSEMANGPEPLAAESSGASKALLGLAASVAADLYGRQEAPPVGQEEQLAYGQGGARQGGAQQGGAQKGESLKGTAQPGGEQQSGMELEEGGAIPEMGRVPAGAWYASAGVETFRARFHEEILKNDIFQKSKVSDVIGAFRFTPFLPVDPSESLLSLLLLMSMERLRLAPLVAPRAPEPLTLVTQMGVLDFLWECRGLPWFDAIAGQSLQSLGLPVMEPGAMVKVYENEFLMEPFRLMLEHDVSGVPVVRRSGGEGDTLVANVSASDILQLLHAPHLFEGAKDPSTLTVGDLVDVASLRLGGRRETIGPVMKPPIHCTTSDTLEAVMGNMHRSRIRRVYVVGGGEELLGVVTLRDMIAAFVSTEMARATGVQGYGA